jgi:hypothetical protein
MHTTKSVFYFLLAIPLVFLAVIPQSLAAMPQGTYTNWNWSPPSTGYSNLQHSLSIEDVTPDAPYFWAHQFSFVNGDVGYMGLQSHGSRVDGTVGKTVVFSVFKSGIAATPESCHIDKKGFDGYEDMSGSSCRIAYDWVLGHKYTMRTEIVKKDETGTWWGAWIKDENEDVETFIANIAVPSTWGGIGDWTVMWSEYFGEHPATCEALPYSRVHFYPPTANDGSATPSGTSNELSKGTSCTNSEVTNAPEGTLQEMGM